jgi:parvulin-like peptidyl-prolyl isomerase
VPGAGQNSSINKFAVSEDKGAISDPIKTQNGYCVYIIAEKVPPGYFPWEEIKATLLTNSVKNEKKLDMLKSNALELRSKISSDLKEAVNVNSTLTVVPADSVSVAKPNAMIGTDYDFNNAVFKLQPGQISEPIRTSRGYYIVQMKSIVPFDQNKFQQDFETLRNTLITQKKQSITQEWITELKNKAVIVDNRDKFFR